MARRRKKSRKRRKLDQGKADTQPGPFEEREPKRRPKSPAMEGIEGLPPMLRQLGVGGALAFLLRAKDRFSLASGLAQALSRSLRELGVDVHGSSPRDALDAWSRVTDVRLALRVEADIERWAANVKAAPALEELPLGTKAGDETPWAAVGVADAAHADDARRRVAWQCAHGRKPGGWRPVWEEVSVLLQVHGVSGALRVLARRESPGPDVAVVLGRYLASALRRDASSSLAELVMEVERETRGRREVLRRSLIGFAIDVKRYVRALDIGRP